MHPDESKPKVGKGQTEAGPPAAVGKAHHQHASGLIGRRTGQLGHVRIAADDAVHDDDIGGFNLGPRLGEVHDPSLDAVTEASLDYEFTCSSLVGGCELNIDPCHPGFEQLDLDGSDASPHLEQCLATDAPLPDETKDSLGRPIEAVALVALCFSGRILLAEDLPVALGCAAIAHSGRRARIE